MSDLFLAPGRIGGIGIEAIHQRRSCRYELPQNLVNVSDKAKQLSKCITSRMNREYLDLGAFDPKYIR